MERKDLPYLVVPVACIILISGIIFLEGFDRINDRLYRPQGYFDTEFEYTSSTSIQENTSANFVYEITNRWFTSYEAQVEINLWESGEKLGTIRSTKVDIGPFGTEEINFELDAQAYGLRDKGFGSEYKLKIHRNSKLNQVDIRIN